ncbi:hypothetical protein DMC25_22430, partial [Caulobacter sp. D4A]
MAKRNPANEIPAYLKALNNYAKKVNLLLQTPEKQAQIVYAFTKSYFDNDPGLGVFRVDSPGVDPTIFKSALIKAVKRYAAALPFDVGAEIGYDPQTGGVTLSVEGTYKKQGVKSVVTLGGTKAIDLNTFGLAGLDGELGNLLKLGLKVYSSPFDETISIEYSFGGLGLTKTSAIVVGRDDGLVTSTLSGWIRDSINNNGLPQDSLKYQDEITARMLVNIRNAERTHTNYDLAADLAAQIFLKTQPRRTENTITLYWAEGKITEYYVQRTRDRVTGAATLKVSYVDKSITTVGSMVGEFTTEAFYQYDQKTGAMLGRSYRYTRKADGVQFIDLAGSGDVKPATADLIQAFRRRTDSFCFLAGTEVLMADGSVKSIEHVRVGDQVQSFDETGALQASTVVEIYPGEAAEWLRLPNGVEVTPGHAFLTERGDFQSVGEMVEQGVKAVAADGGAVDLSGAEAISSEVAVPIYNFEVALTHTYIAGGLRVHNTSRPPSLSDDAGIWSAPKFISNGVYEYTTTDENGTWTYRTHDADGDGVVDYTTYEVERAGGWKERGRLGTSEDGVVATVLQEIPPVRFADFAQALGSALGSYLGNGNVATSVAASAVLGAVGQNIGQLIDLKHGLDLGFHANGEIKKAFADFNQDLGQAFQGAVAGQIGSYLSLELGKALGLSGFGAELFQSVGGTITSTIIGNAMGGRALFDGLRAAEAFGTSTSAAAAGGYSAGVLGSAIGSFFGSKLGSMVVPVRTQAGAALSSLGSTLGTIAFSSGTSAGIVSTFAAAIHAQLAASFGRIAASILVPGIGAFVGFVIGALIGNLFGRKKPKIPTASAETVLQLPYARYEVGSIVTANGGNRALVTSMATLARDTLNGVIGMVAYTDDTAYVSNLNGYSTTQIYGHTGNQIYVKVNGVQKNFGSSDEAVGYGTAIAIKNTKIVGGDIFAKRAISNSLATDITALASDINLAAEYRRYLESRYEINALIAASPTTEFAAGWLIELNSISELGIGKWSTSDFYGGLRGFLDSFDLKSRKMGYEDIRVFAVGDGMEIQSRKADSDGLFSILSQSQAGPGDNDVLNARFGDGLAGWDLATWQVGNPQRGVNLSADWSGNGNDVFWMCMPGAPAAGSVIDMRSAVMVSSAGTLYEGSVKAAQHRGLAQMYMEFYDANMNLLSVAFMAGSGLESGAWQGNLANFNTISGTATAPAGTAYRRMVLRLVATAGGTDPYGFFTQPTSRPADTATSSWDTEGEVLNIEDLSQIGYAITTPGATTSGNDLIDQRLNTGGVVIDDNHTETEITYEYIWNGWDYEYIEHVNSVTVSGGDDIFVGGQGGDQLYGRSGWDWLDGRGGNDYLDGGDGADTLLGRGGNDSLIGGSGDDYLAGDTGDDGLYGGVGNDVLVGGDGADTLQGEDGDDTFILTADYTWNWIVGGNFDFNSDPNGKDTVSAERFTFGVTLDLDVRPADWNSHPDAAIANPASRLLEVRSADGSQWYSSSGLINIENATGSDYDDRLFGSAGNNVLKGLAGDDELYGREGDDILEGGAGADLLVGGGYFDTASYEGSSAGVYVDLSTGDAFGGDAENDILQEIENLRGSQAADQLKGNFFHNRLEGLGGDDWFVATNGEDTYVGGEGKDFIDYSEGFANGTSTYQVWVEDGYWEYDQWDYSQYWVSTGGHYETTTTTVAALNINLGSGYAQVRGVDGTVSNHTLTGVEGVLGTDYADTIGGGAADETFIGGAGNDYLYGGGGADTYVLNRGDGSDTIVEDSAGWNVVSFGADVKFSDIWGGTAGGASGWLDLGIRGDAQVRVGANFYPTAGNNKIKSIDMGGASQLDIGSVNFGVASDDNSTTLVGSKTNSDLIMAMNGDDIVWGAQSGQVESNGNVVIGGLGNDQIHTSNGDDQFGYDRGEGLDIIWDTGGEDTLAFGASVAAGDVIYQVVGNDLYIAARDLSNTALTASQVADRVQIVGGGVKYVTMDGYSNTVLYESFNTVEYVLAGGTSIDLRKLDIAW